jgi:hypothetical protein
MQYHKEVQEGAAERAAQEVSKQFGIPWSARPDAANYAAGWVPDRRPIYLGVNSVPIPSSPKTSADSGAATPANDTHSPHPIPPQPIGTESISSAAPRTSTAAPATEHNAYGCRILSWNMDSGNRVHRRVVAIVNVTCSLEGVWRVVSDYERLHEIVPVLVSSELVPPPRGRDYPPGMKRVRQIASKQLPYVQLHTEVVLDVLEKATSERRELQFRQHRSNFDILQVRCKVHMLHSLHELP